MAKIAPFEGLRPKNDLAQEVASLPYDVLNVAEARRFKDRPHNFYHITRSEIDLPERTDVHSPLVYEQAAENLKRFLKEGVLIQDKDPYYYLYQITMNDHQQTGLVCVSSVEDYEKGIIKKHEFTRPEKEKDRIDHIKATRAQTGVVLLTYREVPTITKMVDEWKANHKPVVDFTSEDEVQHAIWVIDDYGKISAITQLFKDEVPATYIADGHHRAASAASVASEFKTQNLDITGNEAFNYFLTCIVPSNQMQILDYNRVVKDLNGRSVDQFMTELKKDFEVEAIGKNPYKPVKPHEFGLYLDQSWYKMVAKKSIIKTDIIGRLDVSMLQDEVLDKLLGIKDPRTDDRVDFVGGIRGLEELAKRVDSGEMKVAFSCFPVSLDQLLAVADAGKVMPPKSTWFEPKTRDGLITHLI